MYWIYKQLFMNAIITLYMQQKNNDSYSRDQTMSLRGKSVPLPGYCTMPLETVALLPQTLIQEHADS